MSIDGNFMISSFQAKSLPHVHVHVMVYLGVNDMYQYVYLFSFPDKILAPYGHLQDLGIFD